MNKRQYWIKGSLRLTLSASRGQSKWFGLIRNMKGGFSFCSSCRQSVHLCLLLHRVQRHGPGWPRRPVSAPVGESAAPPAPAALFPSSGLSCLNNFAGVCAAVEGQHLVPRGRGVPRGLHPADHAVQRGELQARRHLQPRLRLCHHHGLVLLQQRIPGDALHGLRATVSPQRAATLVLHGATTEYLHSFEDFLKIFLKYALLCKSGSFLKVPYFYPFSDLYFCETSEAPRIKQHV